MFLFHRPVWSSMHKVLSQTPVMESQALMAAIMAFVGIPAIIAISAGFSIFTTGPFARDREGENILRVK
jgi:peptidoglycan/LPS O-acetylase OafA/YrhL